MPSRCAVFGCDNQNDKKDRWIVMPHVKQLSFHGAPDDHFKKWEALINRQDKMWKGVNKSTKVCSNHFKLGRPFPASPHPTRYMKGYDVNSGAKRPPPRERSTAAPPKKRKRAKATDHSYIESDAPCCCSDLEDDSQSVPVHDETTRTSAYSLADLNSEHGYGVKNIHICDNCSSFVQEMIVSNMQMSQHIRDLEQQIKFLQSPDKNQTPQPVEPDFERRELDDNEAQQTESDEGPRITIEMIKHSTALVYMHTGVQNYETFKWILDEVSHGAENMHYYRGSESLKTKTYQEKNSKKPGPDRKLRHEDELLLTLMRLKLDLLEDYLAFLFRISESTVSQILSTWIPFLSRELESLIYWPSQEEVHDAYPDCFKKYDTVRAIIDCTEVAIQKPSLASANSQIFSSYKNKPTVKFLIACTPNGTVSFVSKPAGGRMSDKKLVQTSGLPELFQAGDVCMADRGFTIQDLLLPYGARLVMPPFTVKGKQFTVRKAAQTKTIANARIHIERVINRWKDFRILQGTVPLSMRDLIGHVGKICGALVNLLPSVVPLSKNKK